MIVRQDLRRLLRSYRMPAEWDPHLATWLVWPHNTETWPGRIEEVQRVFAMVAAALLQSERVRMIVDDADQIAPVRERIADASDPSSLKRLEIHVVPTDDSWIRDTGPILVNSKERGVGYRQIALDFRFNSWGGKYPGTEIEDAVAHRLSELLELERVEPGIVLEGGSIDVNGQGALLTTESCLLNPNRNPDLSREEIEDCLRDFLGAGSVLWLGEGIAGDDTDGHIDDIARFVAGDTVVATVEPDPADPNHRPLEDNLRRLRAMRDRKGRPFRIVTIPMPPPLFDGDRRLPASYVNFYIANSCVLAPTFECSTDAVALRTLGNLFPGRRIIGIPSRDLVLGFGSVHCLTLQQPLAEN